MPRDSRVDPLIEYARLHCEGCRVAWRLDGWMHRTKPKIECTVQPIRQKLRDIAAECRRKEKEARNARA